jgi:hypothetical protein
MALFIEILIAIEVFAKETSETTTQPILTNISKFLHILLSPIKSQNTHSSCQVLLFQTDTWSGMPPQANPRRQERPHRGSLAMLALPHSPGLSPAESH